MDAGSLIGFALVFVLVTWTLSATLLLAVWIGRRRLRQRGPAAERRAAELAAAIPVLVGLAVVGVLAARSQLGVDHCQLHDHHAHLCFAHGGAWIERAWAVALVAAAAVLALTRLGALVASLIRSQRSLSRLRRASHASAGITWVDTPHALCFVAGIWRPQIFVSTGVWAGLGDDERAAMLAHERAHIRHRDVARRLAVEMLSSVGAPLATSVLRGVWDPATERLCDARAAEEARSGEVVARAMVQACRLGVRSSPVPAAFAPAVHTLTDRVQAVLDREPTGDRAAQLLAGLVLSVAIGLSLVAAAYAEPLHHLLETLLG